MHYYGTHTASIKIIFDHLQNVHTYLLIDAEFHADFKNVYFGMPILRLSRVMAKVVVESWTSLMGLRKSLKQDQ